MSPTILDKIHFQRRKFKDDVLQLVFSEITEAIQLLRNTVRPLLKGPANGVLISTTVATTPTQVDHGLGRTPTGWFVISAEGPVSVHQTATSANSLTLVATATTSVKLWIF